MMIYKGDSDYTNYLLYSPSYSPSLLFTGNIQYILQQLCVTLQATSRSIRLLVNIALRKYRE